MVYPFGSRDVESAHNREIKRLANVGINVFGHRMMKIWHPVRSALNKHHIAWLVLQWVTMWESQVLNSTFSFLLPPLPLPPCGLVESLDSRATPGGFVSSTGTKWPRKLSISHPT